MVTALGSPNWRPLGPNKDVSLEEAATVAVAEGKGSVAGSVGVAVELPDNLERDKAIRLEVAAKFAVVRSVLVRGGLKAVRGGILLVVVELVVAVFVVALTAVAAVVE